MYVDNGGNVYKVLVCIVGSAVKKSVRFSNSPKSDVLTKTSAVKKNKDACSKSL